MEYYGELLKSAIGFLGTEFSLFGFTVSYLGMFYFLCIVDIIGLILWFVIGSWIDG